MATKIGYPLPPMERIIPLVFSTWNAMKSGSDTISKLFAHEPHNIPADEAQAGAVAVVSQPLLGLAPGAILAPNFSSAPDPLLYVWGWWKWGPLFVLAPSGPALSPVGVFAQVGVWLCPWSRH